MKVCSKDACTFAPCKKNRSTKELPFIPTPMPDENNEGHYVPMAALLKMSPWPTPTNKYIPSFCSQVSVIAESVQGCPASDLCGQTARDFMECTDCKKPRMIYSKTKFDVKTRDYRAYTKYKNSIKHMYLCGCVFLADNISQDDPMRKKGIYMRLTLNCQVAVESSYYTTKNLKVNKFICCYCLTQVSADRIKAAKEVYRSVIPICLPCEQLGKKIMHRFVLPKKK